MKSMTTLSAAFALSAVMAALSAHAVTLKIANQGDATSLDPHSLQESLQLTITGESAPVIRESGGDRSAVTGGTRVLSDEIVVRISSKPGET